MSVAEYYPFNGDRGRLRLGLRPIKISEWIQYEEDYSQRIREKKELIAAEHKRVLDTLNDSLVAQQELLSLLIEHLQHYHADRFEINNIQISSLADNETYTKSDYEDCPLELASYLIPDDICILEKTKNDFRLVAASVCAPTWWELSEKIGKPLSKIHSPIANLEEKIGRMIRHFLQNLTSDDCYQRSNWFLSTRPDLCVFPDGFNMYEELSNLNIENIDRQLYLRCERQSFRKLKNTGYIVFTINVYVSPINIVKEHKAIAEDLLIAMNTMTSEQKLALGIKFVEKPLRSYLQKIL